MRPIDEKRDAMRRANRLLDAGDDEQLRYVAVELRRCIEAVVYEKLLAYKERIPEKAARIWQPPQAFRALLMFEPDADRTREIRFARETIPGQAATGPGTVLGIDRRFSASWLNKTYNKIGSYLHAVWPFADSEGPDWAGAKEFFKEVLTRLKPLVETSFTSTVAVVSSVECAGCSWKITSNAEGLEKVGEVTCLNCGYHYHVERDGDGFSYQPDLCSAPCPDCDSLTPIPAHQLADSFRFSCVGCGRTCVVRHYWASEPA